MCRGGWLCCAGVSRTLERTVPETGELRRRRRHQRLEATRRSLDD